MSIPKKDAVEEMNELASRFRIRNPTLKFNQRLLCSTICKNSLPLPIKNSPQYLKAKDQVFSIIYEHMRGIELNFLCRVNSSIIQTTIIQTFKDIAIQFQRSPLSAAEDSAYFNASLLTLNKRTIALQISTFEFSRMASTVLTALSRIVSNFNSENQTSTCLHDVFRIGSTNIDLLQSHQLKGEVLHQLYNGVNQKEQVDFITNELLEWIKESVEAGSQLFKSGYNHESKMRGYITNIYNQLTNLILETLQKFILDSNFLFHLEWIAEPFYLLKAMLTVHTLVGALQVHHVLFECKTYPQILAAILSCGKTSKFDFSYLSITIAVLATRSIEELERMQRNVQSISEEFGRRSKGAAKNKSILAKGRKKDRKLLVKQLASESQLAGILTENSKLEPSAVVELPSSILEAPGSPTSSTSTLDTSTSSIQLPLPLEPQENITVEAVLVSLVADLEIESSDDENMPDLDDASDTDSD